MRMHGFITKLFHFPIRIFSLQRREVDHVQHQLQSIELGFIFDTSFGKAGSPFFHPYLVDTRGEGEVGNDEFFLRDRHIG